MNENTVGFVRSLVGCQELSESVIQVVLTAAGANELLPDGNRKLAQLGLGAPGFVIDFSGALMGLSRDFTSKLKSRINSEKHRADIARRAGIDKYLNYNTRPGGHSSGVLALATSALIGAVYLEKKSFKSVINALYLLGILNNGRDEIDLMDVFDDKQSDVHPVSSVWGSDVPQNLEVDHLAQDFGNIRDLSTVSGSERLGTLSSFYSGREEIWGVSSDDFTLTCQQSPVRSAENTSQPIEERQGFDMSNRLLQLNLFPAELNDPDFSTLFNQHVSLFDNGDPLIVHDNTRPLDGFSAQVTNTENQTSKSSAKRKSPSSSGGQRRKKQFLDGGFKASLLQDAELSQAQGKPLPQETYFKPSIEDKLLNLGKESFCGFCTFLVQVGGTQSLIAFREALEYTRKMGDQPHNRQWIARELPNSERFKIIREIQANATYLQILQWNHILCLFRCSGRLELCSNAGIIPVSGDGLSSQPRTRGNPRNIEVAKIINKMMEENFPELGPGSKDYKGRRREVSELRKLGQRLHMLAQRFGDGVIGLLPFNRCGDEAVPVMTKTMIINPVNDAFEKFVEIVH